MAESWWERPITFGIPHGICKTGGLAGLYWVNREAALRLLDDLAEVGALVRLGAHPGRSVLYRAQSAARRRCSPSGSACAWAACARTCRRRARPAPCLLVRLTCGVGLCVGALRLHFCSNSVWAVSQRSCAAAAPRRDGCALPCLCGWQVLAPTLCCPAGKKARHQLTTDTVADVDMRFLSFAVASERARGGSQPCQDAMPMRAECAGGADDDRCRGGRGGRVAVRAADVGALGGPRGGRVCARQLHPGAPLCSCHPNCAAPGLGPCTGFPVFHTGCLPVML